jgi:chemotaxis protein MotA
MDKATLIGLMLGGLALLGGNYLEGGSLSMILQITALVIVFGGTLGAVCLSFTSAQLVQAWRELRFVFKRPPDQGPALMSRIIELAYRSRREGLLALDAELANLSDPFLRRALQLVVDGHHPQQVREIMEDELAHLDETGVVPARVFEAAGGYAPTIGILGAVLGLIQVMQHLTEPAKLGTGVAVAFVATIYGVGSANLLFLPIAHKLRLRQEHLRQERQMILEGIVSLAQGDNPHLMAERMKGFVLERAAAEEAALASAKVHVLTPRRKLPAKPHVTPSSSSQ